MHGPMLQPRFTTGRHRSGGRGSPAPRLRGDQRAPDIEQFPGQAIGLEDDVDPAAHEAGEALEATEDGQRGGIEVRADLVPLPYNAV
jgi:hypothetical protein